MENRLLKLIRSKCNPQSVVRHFSSMREPKSLSPKFNSNNEEDGSRKVENPPQPIPNRPLRGERGERPLYRPQSQSQSQSPNHRELKNVRLSGSTHHHNPPSDDNFLEKFKLRLDKNKENDIPLRSNPPSPPPDNNDSEDQSSNSPPPDANDIFKKMKETGLIPNAVAMLDGLCKDGLVQEAMKLFGLMREKGTIPEVVVYTAVVDGFCKAQKLDDAKRVFKKMLDNSITPNAFSYTVLIQGLYKCNSLDDAVDFTFQMLDAGHSPNVTTFVGLVDGLCREKGVVEAQSVVEALRKKGFFINEKAIRDFFDKNAPFSSSVWEAIFGRKPSQKPF